MGGEVQVSINGTWVRTQTMPSLRGGPGWGQGTQEEASGSHGCGCCALQACRGRRGCCHHKVHFAQAFGKQRALGAGGWEAWERWPWSPAHFLRPWKIGSVASPPALPGACERLFSFAWVRRLLFLRQSRSQKANKLLCGGGPSLPDVQAAVRVWGAWEPALH